MHDGETSGFGAYRAQFPGRTVPGQTIGLYTLEGLVGEGGMGEVWLAEQKEPVRRRVALKLIKSGMDTAEVVARFDSERRALAMMDHPNIAKVFDAGSTPDGRPFFAMEYVPGVAITAFCDQNHLTTRERLELFIQVCEGVQHAHLKAIIHRDLKPSNILVSHVDAKPLPRIIDFGVAKAVTIGPAEETLFTHFGSVIGTLEYMSPEQAASGGHDIDTRTDVYALGVVLYEMLVGVRPLELRKLAFDEALKALREQDAPKPSTKVRQLPAEASTTAAHARGADTPTLIRQLRGDLDAILMKAVEKDRAFRYATPMEFASDIRRYLNNEPIIARPASTFYRARKYVRRHRVGVSMAALGVVLLVAFAVMQTVELRRIRRERDRADHVTEFMTEMFKVSNPSEARGNSVTAREILDKASTQIDTGLRNDPETQAKLTAVMGTVYESLGLYAKAEPMLRGALDTQRRTLGSTARDTLNTQRYLANDIEDLGHLPDAEKMMKETLDLERRNYGINDRDSLLTETGLAVILSEQAKFPDAEQINRRVLQVADKQFGPDDPISARSRTNLAINLARQGKHIEAEKLFRETLASDLRLHGSDDLSIYNDYGNIANALMMEARYPECEQFLRQSLAGKRRIYGPDHPLLVYPLANLALVLQDEARYPEAEQFNREALAIALAKSGPEHRTTLVVSGHLGEVLAAEGKFADAEKIDRQVVDTELRVLGPVHLDTLHATHVLASVLIQENHIPEAEKLLRGALENEKKAQGTDQPDYPDTLLSLAETLARQHKTAETQATLDEWLALAKARIKEAPILSLDAYSAGSSYALIGKPDIAFEQLNYALDHGLDAASAAAMEKDDNLKSLHPDPRWPALMARAKQIVQAAK